MSETILSKDLGNFYFGQLHPYLQDFFDEQYSQHTRIRLRDMPHYISWRNDEFVEPETSKYYQYLKESWKFYSCTNSHKTRMNRIQKFIALKEDIIRNGVKVPISLVVTYDGSTIIIDGNHRASLAYHFGLDVPCIYIKLESALRRTIWNKKEFYGTKRKNMPYQSIYFGQVEIMKGRRRDTLERFNKMDINDIRDKTICDLGSNIGVSAILAWHFGAKDVTAIEYSLNIATSALRLSTLLDERINVVVQDLGEPIRLFQKYDTVFCFSVHAHVKDKKMLEQNIANITGKVLYFEGHEHTNREKYEHIFRHFNKVEELGFNRNGRHNDGSSRPFFRCQKEF